MLWKHEFLGQLLLLLGNYLVQSWLCKDSYLFLRRPFMLVNAFLQIGMTRASQRNGRQTDLSSIDFLVQVLPVNHGIHYLRPLEAGRQLFVRRRELRMLPTLLEFLRRLSVNFYS